MCPDCQIVLENEVWLGDATGPGMLETEYNLLRRGPRGRYYVFGAAPFITVFGPDGDVVRRVGERGAGPGQFQTIGVLLVAPDGNLIALDDRQRRLSTFSADYDLLTTTPVRFAALRGVMAGENIVINAPLSGRGPASDPLHWIDANGEPLASFGLIADSYFPDHPDFMENRILGQAGPDSIWAAWINQYVLEEWSPRGELKRVVRRDASWFEPSWNPSVAIDVAPAPTITGVVQDGSTLWVLILVADDRWRSAVEPSGRFFRVLDRDMYRDTIIEAIDLEAGRLIATTRVAVALKDFAAPGFVYQQGTDSTGDPVVPVWRLQLSGSPPRPFPG